MKTICIKTKLKHGSLHDVRNWFLNLKNRTEEVLESLRNEGVNVESAFLDKQGDDYYLIYYMRADDIASAYKVFNQSTLPIDNYYKDCWKNYCEGRIVLEELLDLELLESKKFYE